MQKNYPKQAGFKKIALIVGAGAVENDWQPVVKAVNSHYNFDFQIDSDGANSIMARLVYLLRFYATGTFADAEKGKNALLAEVNEIKSKIALHLKLAQQNKTIRARKELKDILYRFVFSEINKTVLISTNWDTVIDAEINLIGESNFPKNGSDISALHIHGSIDSPLGLYLPSEVTREAYRTKEEDFQMGNLHGTTWRTIEECNIAILYGLSLDPLDAELCQTMAAGWSSPNLREIIIINPEHEKVAQRVRLLMEARYKAEVNAYSPNDLAKKIKY